MKTNRMISAIDVGTLVARLLLGAIFPWFGLAKALTMGATISYFAALDLPVPPAAYAVAVLIELGGGVLLVTGLFFRPAALVLAAWCIATALVAHTDFSNPDAEFHFFKNVSMCGGFLYAALLGPGRMSFDALRSRIQ